MQSQEHLRLHDIHTHTVIMHTETLTLSFKWTPNGARKWSKLSAVETKTRLDTSAVKHMGFDTVVQKVLDLSMQKETMIDPWEFKQQNKRQLSMSCNHLKSNDPDTSVKFSFM